MAGHLYDDADKGPPMVGCAVGPSDAEELLECILQENNGRPGPRTRGQGSDNAARLSCVHKLTQASSHCPSEGWVAELGGVLTSKRCEAVTATAPRACDAAVRAHTCTRAPTAACYPAAVLPCCPAALLLRLPSVSLQTIRPSHTTSPTASRLHGHPIPPAPPLLPPGYTAIPHHLPYCLQATQPSHTTSPTASRLHQPSHATSPTASRLHSHPTPPPLLPPPPPQVNVLASIGSAAAQEHLARFVRETKTVRWRHDVTLLLTGVEAPTRRLLKALCERLLAREEGEDDGSLLLTASALASRAKEEPARLAAMRIFEILRGRFEVVMHQEHGFWAPLHNASRAIAEHQWGQLFHHVRAEAHAVHMHMHSAYAHAPIHIRIYTHMRIHTRIRIHITYAADALLLDQPLCPLGGRARGTRVGGAAARVCGARGPRARGAEARPPRSPPALLGRRGAGAPRSQGSNLNPNLNPNPNSNLNPTHNPNPSLSPSPSPSPSPRRTTIR